MKLGLAATAALSIAAFALPATASGIPTVKTDRACYGPQETINLIGAGWPANGQIVATQDGQQIGFKQTDALGAWTGAVSAPVLGSGEKFTGFVVSDANNLAITAKTFAKLTALDVIGSLSGRPEKAKKLRIRGFTRARTIYAHVKRGRKVRNIRLGKAKAPCGTLRVKKKFFPRNRIPSGLYTIQIDGKRRYSSNTRPALQKVVQIFPRVVRRSDAFESPWKPLL